VATDDIQRPTTLQQHVYPKSIHTEHLTAL